MPTQPMTKFVVNDPTSETPATLYLKAPSDEQLDAVLAWMHNKGLDMLTCLEGTAVFTKTGKGKPAPAIAIQFQSRIDFNAAAAKMAELYPAPKSLDGVKLTDHEVTDQATDMPIAPIQSEEQTEGMDGLADDDETRCYSVEELQAARQGLTPGDRALAQARQAINVGGPMPSVVATTSADGVPF